MLQALGGIVGRDNRADLDQLGAGDQAELAHLNVVGALAGLAVGAAEGVAGEPADGGPLPDEHAGPCSLRTSPSVLRTSTAWRAVDRAFDDVALYTKRRRQAARAADIYKSLPVSGSSRWSAI